MNVLPLIWTTWENWEMGNEESKERPEEERTENNGRWGGEVERRQMEINGPYKSNSVNSPEWEKKEAEEQ